ncbi:cation:proton antiporter [Sulfurovum sp. ST-21]|uniref:Cation:proton antiporter n=1 Tax=Sulfurovum indicum TaxID=2779528 RepID=A0A7M1S642_9BACT|nr:cation:proton antiporter [Sulfurovum indicum]QOR62806.1 cation:proton antiporter [Sulfurovum indicum]
MDHAMYILIITIAISTVLNVILKRFEIPTIIGYVLAGFTISSIFHFAEESKEFLMHLAEFGIVFLMFTIGLEFSVKHLKSMKKEVFLFGSLQVILTGLLFTALGYYLFGLDARGAIVIGFALSLSSTAIVLKILNENNEIHSGYGRLSLGILLFQDLAVIPILLMVSFFTSKTHSMSRMLLETAGGAVIIYVVLFILGKYFIERFFDWITSTNSEEIFLVAVLLGVISASAFAQAVGFTYSLGAFLAGMMLAETKYRYRIEADLIPFRDILLGVFFVTIGMLVDWHSIVDYIHYILALLVVVMLIKAVVIFTVLYSFVQRRTALKTSMALFQIGEFALAVFALARSNDLISSEVNQILIVTVILSMILTPFVLHNIKRLADRFISEPETLRERAIVGREYEDHVIVCGYGPIGQKVVSSLKERNILYLILEHDVKVVDAVISNGEEAIFLANAAQKRVLSHFNVEKSAAIVVTIENELQRRLICENIASFSHHVKSIVKVNNEEEEKVYNEMGITTVINARDTIANLLSQEVIVCHLT